MQPQQGRCRLNGLPSRPNQNDEQPGQSGGQQAGSSGWPFQAEQLLARHRALTVLEAPKVELDAAVKL